MHMMMEIKTNLHSEKCEIKRELITGRFYLVTGGVLATVYRKTVFEKILKPCKYV